MKKSAKRHVDSLISVTDIILESLRDIKKDNKEIDEFCIEAIKIADQLKEHLEGGE